jgi:hypothetical protein
MRTTGEGHFLKRSSRRGSRRRGKGGSFDVPELLLEDLRDIGSRLRVGAREVLREYLGGLNRMGLDTVESATYLSCAFLNAMLEEAPAVRAELSSQLERFLRNRGAAPAGRGGRGRASPSRGGLRGGGGEREPGGRTRKRIGRRIS